MILNEYYRFTPNVPLEGEDGPPISLGGLFASPCGLPASLIEPLAVEGRTSKNSTNDTRLELTTEVARIVGLAVISEGQRAMSHDTVGLLDRVKSHSLMIALTPRKIWSRGLERGTGSGILSSHRVSFQRVRCNTRLTTVSDAIDLLIVAM